MSIFIGPMEEVLESAPELCVLDVWGLIPTTMIDKLDRVQLRNELEERNITFTANQRETALRKKLNEWMSDKRLEC
jgi:hypothetical protein